MSLPGADLGFSPPSKLVYISAKRTFRKFLGSVTKYGYLKIVQRGDPLGQQGVESLWGGGGGAASAAPVLYGTFV